MKQTVIVFISVLAVSIAPMLMSFPTLYLAGHIYASVLIVIFLLLSAKNRHPNLYRHSTEECHPDPDVSGEGSRSLQQQPLLVHEAQSSFRLARNPVLTHHNTEECHPELDSGSPFPGPIRHTSPISSFPRTRESISTTPIPPPFPTILFPLTFLLASYLASATLSPLHPLMQTVSFYTFLHLGSLIFWLSEKTPTPHTHVTVMHLPTLITSCGIGVLLSLFLFFLPINQPLASLSRYGALSAGILFAITQELFFRRIIYRTLARYSNTYTALFAIAILLGGFYSPLNFWGICAGVLFQITLTLLYQRTKALQSSIIAHSIASTISYVLQISF